MKPISSIITIFILIFSLTSCVSVETPQINSPIKKSSKSIDETKKLSISKNYGKLPLRFEENNGQTDEQVKFLSRGNGYSMFLTPTEAVMVLSKGSKKSKFDPMNPQKVETPEKVESSVVRMKLLKSNKTPKITGEEKQITKSNYLIGNDKSKWKTGVSNYGKVKYEEVYKGIDLVYYGNQRKLEYDFVVKPGADYKNISFSFAGADEVSIDEKGNLVLKTSTGEVVQKAPIIYQEVDGRRIKVAGNYIFLDDEKVAFHLGIYDNTQPLVIDPVLEYSTFLGSSNFDQGYGIAVDADGNAYVTGFTSSTTFPTTAGAFDETFNGGVDVFVAKLNPAGSALVYSTFLGGSGSDIGLDIAVDADGNAYVTGQTVGGGFPTTAGAFDETFNGGVDVFVSKLNPAGSALVYSTFLGGSGSDIGLDIAVDADGNAYVTGRTIDAVTDYPTTSGAFDENHNGDRDVFVTKLNPAGSALVYSTFLGGSGPDEGEGIAVDADGNAYVTGRTSDAVTDYPTTSGAFDENHNGSSDVFVSKLSDAIPDTTDPIITIPADKITQATAPQTTVDIGQATATDDISDSVNIAIINDAPATFPLGSTDVTWTATDEAGNSASAIQNITVVDTTPPVLTVPIDVTVIPTEVNNVVAIGQATATDLVSDPSNIIITNDAPPTFPVDSTTTVTWTATDEIGNTGTAEQIVTVTTFSVLTVIVEDGFTGEVGDVRLDTHTPDTTGTGWGEVLTAGGCFHNVNASQGNAESNYRPNGLTGVITLSQPNPASPDYDVEIDTGSLFTQSNWHTYLLGRYQDNNNFYAVLVSNFYINRTVALYKFEAGLRTLLGQKAVTAVANSTIGLKMSGAAIKVFVNGVEEISAIDSAHGSAGSAGMGSGSLMNLYGQCHPGNQINHYTVTQVNTANQAPPPLDNTPPILTVPGPVTAEATDLLTPVALGTATAVDNVSILPNISITNDAPLTFPVGDTTVTYTATDEAGNFSTAPQTVTITDTTAPTVIAPGNVTVATAGPLTTVILGVATANDLVDGAITPVDDVPAAGFPLGITTVTYTATDTAGNTGTAEQIVTVTTFSVPTVIVGDSFTGESGDIRLDTHIPDIIGTGWTEVQAAGNCVHKIDASEGNVETNFINNGSAGVITLSQPNPASPDYDVEIDTGSLFTQSNWHTYLLGRYQDNNNFYAVLVSNFYINRTVTLFKFVSGVRTKLGEKKLLAVANSTIKLEMIGTAIKVFVDGTEEISVTDSTHTLAGSAGIGSGSLMGLFGKCHLFNEIDKYTVTQAN